MGGGATPDAGGGLTSADGGGGGATPDAGESLPSADAGGGAAPDAGGGLTPADAGHDSGHGGATHDASSDASPVATPTTKATMYLDNWSGTFASWATKIDFTKMTHLILAFATVTGTNSWNDLGDTSDVQTLTAAAHAKNVKVLVSIGGAGGDATVISAYQSASNIAPLVANLHTMVTAMNLDGVDVDLETGSGMRSSSNYPAFVSALIRRFTPKASS